MYYSIETAVLRMHSDILQAVDKDPCVFLVLFDKSTIFDMLEYNILMKRFGGVDRTDGTSSAELYFILC